MAVNDQDAVDGPDVQAKVSLLSLLVAGNVTLTPAQTVWSIPAFGTGNARIVVVAEPETGF